MPREELDPLVARARAEDDCEALLQARPLRAVHLLRRIEIFEPEDAQQVGVELRFVRRDRHVLAVGGLVHVVEVRAAVEEVGAAVAPAAHGVDAEEDAHELRAAVDHRGVDHLAPSRRRPLDERGEDAHHDQLAAAAEVGEQVDRRHRCVILGSDVPQHAGERQVVDVVADVAGERTVLAPTGHARVHEASVAGAARIGADAESLGDAGPEPFEQHVGLFAQPQDHLGRVGVLEVDARAAAAAVDHRVRRHETGDVRSGRDIGGAVEAQHFGAHVGEQHAGELHRPDVRQLHDADACEWAGHAKSSASRVQTPSFSTRAAFSRRNFGQTWSRNGTPGSSEKMRSSESPIGK